MADYEFWLKSERRCCHNTTVKYLSNFKKIVNRCVRSGKLQRDPFLGFNLAKKEVERQALSEMQLKRISVKQFTVERLSIVRDIFLFCCFTGLAYADVQKLERSEIVEGFDGGKWIIARRQKTNVTSKIPLLPQALSIVRKYECMPRRDSSNRVLPVLTKSKNEFLFKRNCRCL